MARRRARGVEGRSKLRFNILDINKLRVESWE